MVDKRLVFQKAMGEQLQGHSTRKPLYAKLEKLVGVPIISLFTSFRYQVMLEDSDADMLVGLHQKCDLSKGFALMISSPGGRALTLSKAGVTVSRPGSNKAQQKDISSMT